MKKRSLFLSLLACVLFTAVFLFTGTMVVEAADDVIKWKCQVHWPAASVSFKDSAQVVIDRIKERTGGRLDIELFAAGSLVPSKEIFNAVKRGMIQIGVTSSAYPRDQVPLMNVASGLPLNFQNVWEAAYFHQWVGFEDMMKEECAKHGLYYATDKVYPTEVALKKPVKTFDDFNGLKLRSSGVLQTFLSSIGAAASYIPGSEVYAALSSGVVDGAHWGAVQGAYSMGLYDMCKYHLKPALNIAATDIWLVNMKAIEKLPDDIQKVLYAALSEQFWMRTNQYIYLEQKALEKAKKDKDVEVLHLPQGEYVKMQEAAMKIWDETAKKGPQCAKAVEMLRDFQASLGR